MTRKLKSGTRTSAPVSGDSGKPWEDLAVETAQHSLGVAEQVDKLSASVDTGFRIVAERLTAERKTGTMKNQASMFEQGGSEVVDCAKAVLGEEEASRRLNELDFICGSTEEVGLLKDAPTALMSELWFRTAAAIQAPRHFTPDPRAAEKLEKLNHAAGGVDMHAKASYSGETDARGGYTIPTMIEGEILRRIEDNSVVYRQARKIPMRSRELRVPNEATGATVYFTDEGSELTQGEGTFGTNIITAKKITGRAAASIESVEDSAISLIQYVQTIMAEKIGAALDLEGLEGDGTNFTGLNAEANVNSVAVTTTDGENLSYLDLVNAAFSMDYTSDVEGAVWLMHRKTFATVVGLVDSQNRPIFQPSVEQKTPGTIFGFPVFTCSSIATDTTRGATGNTSNVYFGPAKRLLYGLRQGLRFDVTDTGPGWASYLLDMRLVGRFGFTVATPASFAKIVGCTQLA